MKTSARRRGSAIALKTFVGLCGAFAAYYAWFLGSVFYGLWGPNNRPCGTVEVWALQAGAVLFAPPALLGSVGLWFVSRRKQTTGVAFSRMSKVELVLLTVCALANLVILIPAF